MIILAIEDTVTIATNNIGKIAVTPQKTLFKSKAKLKQNVN